MKKILYVLAGAVLLFSACSKGDEKSDAVLPDTPASTNTTSHSNFYVSGNALNDSSGHAFVMRGNNIAVFWFASQYPPTIPLISSLGANSARLVWQVQQLSYTPSLAVLDQALASCVANKLVPIVELHDYTGGTSAADIAAAAAYWTRADVKMILDKYASVLVINMANEWGDGSVSQLSWKNAYTPAITTLRNAGYKMPIMIDAPGYGQSEGAIVTYGTDVLNSDPQKNIIFSVHAYSNWNTGTNYSGRINSMLTKNLCIVFGEFGWNVPPAQQPGGFNCYVDAPLLMQLCQSNHIGYLGWSWTGNDSANACFDMSSSWNDTTHLTTWGRQWAYDPNGVKNTGVKASVYN